MGADVNFCAVGKGSPQFSYHLANCIMGTKNNGYPYLRLRVTYFYDLTHTQYIDVRT